MKTTTAMPAESETRLMGGDQFKKKTMSHRNQTHDNFLVRQLQDDSPEQKKDPPLESATLSYILHHLRGPNWQKMIPLLGDLYLSHKLLWSFEIYFKMNFDRKSSFNR